MEKEMEYLRERLAMYEGQSTPNQPMLNAPHQASDNHSFTPGPVPKTEDDAFLQTQHTQVAATSLLDLRSGSPMFFSIGAGEVRLGHNEVNEPVTGGVLHPRPQAAVLGDCRCCSTAVRVSPIITEEPGQAAERSDLGLYPESAKPPRRQGSMSALYLATSSRTHCDRPNLHSVRRYDAGRHADRPAPTRCCARLPKDEDAVAERRHLWPETDVGCLQHSSANVSKLVNVEFCRELKCFRVSTGNGQPSITLYDSTLDFKTDSEEDMRIIPPTIFVRLRQEMAASRINKLLYSTNSHRFADGAATSYMNLEADRLKEERVKQESGSLDGVDSGMSKDATRSNC
jgi:transcriptional regulatory protein LEU3